MAGTVITQSVLDIYYNKLQTALTNKNAASLTLSNYNSSLTGFWAYYNQANDGNHYQELRAAQMRIQNEINPTIASLTNAETAASAAYTDAYNKYTDAKSNLVSPAELQAHTEAIIANTTNATVTAAAQAELTKAAAAKAESEAAQTTFSAKNKQAILYVSIALVVIFVSGWAFFKFKKKQP